MSSAPPLYQTLPTADTPAAPPPAYYGSADPESGAHFEAKVFIIQSPMAVQMAFVRKVYSILAAQMGLTTIVSALFMYNADIKHVVQANPWAMFLSWFASLGLLISLMVCRHKTPLNMYLLTAFTVAESYMIGTICTFYDSQIVLQAVILTFVVFVGLTIFTIQSKMDFSGMGPFLFTTLWVLIFAGFMQIFLPFSRTFDLLMAVVTAVLFCGYIVFDTYNLFERLSPEEYIVAAVELYLDVINLFLAILRILNDGNRD